MRPGDHAPFLETHANSVRLGRSASTVIHSTQGNRDTAAVGHEYNCRPYYRVLVATPALDANMSKNNIILATLLRKTHISVILHVYV